MWRKLTLGVVFSAIVVVLLLWLAGVFEDKVAAEGGHVAARKVGDAPLATVRLESVPRVEAAVGSVRAVRETAIASKLLAKVVEVNVIAGQSVKAGDVLVRLDDADLKARLEQALAQADAARAARDQAKIEYDRVKRLMEQQAAAQIEWERVQTALKSAEAELQRANEAVEEARTVLGYATIKAPFDGIVVDKRVNVGDTATPGQVLLTLYDPKRMQLVASVRESLAQRLAVGQELGVRIDALDLTCGGAISEIVPEAQSASRSFLVKVTGPCPPGVFAGMFGRLLIPLDAEEVLLIPASAVRRIGQLDIVDVVEGDVLRRRVVQLGRRFGDDVEVLSGLRAGERVVADAQHSM
ncbi:MAG: efflux RND transporter periplasmic adaptor subunit [Planctomycetota bacterium]|nr:MAG: efflux RND transporter periplasmic adaptor subunit [Planctomycetota bacterium]